MVLPRASTRATVATVVVASSPSSAKFQTFSQAGVTLVDSAYVAMLSEILVIIVGIAPRGVGTAQTVGTAMLTAIV
eukprot:m.1129264 g.1129264  ORF g.1129264 m.1129264 type:complete len:76 (+) comp24416_c0_seq6:3695-3922(+)